MNGIAWIVVTATVCCTTAVIVYRYFEHRERLERYKHGIKTVSDDL